MSLRAVLLSALLAVVYWFLALLALSTVQRATGRSTLLTTPEVVAGLALAIVGTWLTRWAWSRGRSRSAPGQR
jgi:hypothetical protein